MSSLEAIAQHLGISRSSVATALRGSRRPKRPATIAKTQAIRAAAAELGYRPNSAAKAVSTGRFGCVTLVGTTAPGRSSLNPRMLWGLHDGLTAFDIHLAVAVIPDEEFAAQGILPKILREQMSDGLLINYTDHIPAQLEAIIEDEVIPALWLNSKQPHDCIRPDDESAARQATLRLIQHGHRNIGYLAWGRGDEDWSERHYSEADRQQGYEQVMASAGLPLRIMRGRRQIPGAERFDFVHAMLAAHDRPSAVLVPCPAVPELMVACHHLGLRVPQDLSIVQIADEATHVMGLRPTSYLVPHEELGRAAGHLVAAKIAQPQKRLEAQLIPFVVKEGDTIAPCH